MLPEQPTTAPSAQPPISFATIYGAQVARELPLIEFVLNKVATASRVELNEADFDTFCRNRQAKLNVHLLQSADEPFERVRLLNMLYEGCLTFLRDAASQLEAGKKDEGAAKLNRAEKIIRHLLKTLDHRLGGVIAGKLSEIYDFALRHLAHARAQSSASKTRAVARIIDKIYQGYLQIELEQDACELFESRPKRPNTAQLKDTTC